MNKPIDIRPDHAAIVQDILTAHLPETTSVRVFGSRAKWSAKTYSDLDLAIKAKQRLPSSLLSELSEAFSESELPFKVDVVDWQTASQEFRDIIDRDGLPLPWPSLPLSHFIDPNRSICYGIVQPGEVVKDGVPIVRVNNFGPSGLDVSSALRVDQSIEAQYARSRLQGDELLVTLVGSVGQSAIAPPELKGWNVARAIGVVPLKDSLNTHWVKFVLAGPQAQDFLLQRANTTVQTTINLRDLSELPIPTPPRPVMERIIAALGALDDKIELNRRMNETLEAMARAIFKDWFGDFGPTRAKMAMRGEDPQKENVARAPYLAPDIWSLFPDRLDDDGKPEGWETFQLQQLANHHTRGVNPLSTPDALFEHFSLPAYDAGRSPARDVGSQIKSNKTTVPTDAILLSKLNPEIERVWLVEAASDRQQICSTEFLAFNPTLRANRSTLFGVFTSLKFREMLRSMVTGTSNSHQRISPPNLLQKNVLTASPPAICLYDKIVAPLLNRVLANRAESRTLAATRDLLLPKLMSGEIRVRDAETLVEAVA